MERSGERLLLSGRGKVVDKATFPVSENLYVIRKGITSGSGNSESDWLYITANRIDK